MGSDHDGMTGRLGLRRQRSTAQVPFPPFHLRLMAFAKVTACAQC